MTERIEESRIEAIASFVDRESMVADIGSDHCQVPILLCKQGKCCFIQAIENKRGPYNRMCKEIEKSGFSSIIHPSFSDGIDKLDSQIDTIVIAGMGGRLIKNILQRNEHKLTNVKTIIIDAHSDKELIFKYMAAISYSLADNKFIYDSNKPYDIQKWVKTAKKAEYSEDECLFGPLNLQRKPAQWIRYWRLEADRISQIMLSCELPEKNKSDLAKLLYKIREKVLNID